MHFRADKIADWLLNGLELESTLFHVGQYCGTWQASTAGRHCASFHVVLHGECWLHLPASAGRDARSTRLAGGDAVFLLRDIPHCVSPDPQPPARGRESGRVGAPGPLAPVMRDATAGGEPGVGLAWAMLVGVPLGFLIGPIRMLELAPPPALQFLRMISPLSWMPIAVMSPGVGDNAVYFLLAFAAVWPLVMSTATGVAQIDARWVQWGESLAATRAEMLWHVYVPGIAVQC